MNPEPAPQPQTSLFRRIGDRFDWVLAVFVLIIGLGGSVYTCSGWRGKSNYYEKRTASLMRDSTKLREVVNTLKAEADKAMDYSRDWEQKYRGQVAANDANVDRLNDQQRELAYQKALVRNGTLAPRTVNQPPLTPASPEVITAGLKTAIREELGSRVIDTLNQSVSVYRVANERTRVALSRVREGITNVRSDLQNRRAAASKGLLRRIFNKKQIKALEKADKDLGEAQKESELEKELNRN